MLTHFSFVFSLGVGIETRLLLSRMYDVWSVYNCCLFRVCIPNDYDSVYRLNERRRKQGTAGFEQNHEGRQRTVRMLVYRHVVLTGVLCVFFIFIISIIQIVLT